MNISEPFLKRPVMTTLVTIGTILFGILSYYNLPVSNLPTVDYPTIEVFVSNPGANPDTMASTCAVPLEKEFMTINRIKSITSQSVQDSTTLILQFELDKPMDEASTDVASAINSAQGNLPTTLPQPPTYQKVNPADTPILYLAIMSPSMSLSDLYEFSHTYLEQRLSMVNGVSQVNNYGEPYAARVQIDPERLAGMNFALDDVALQIVNNNVDMPLGTLYGKKTESYINVDGQLESGAGYDALSVKTKDGAVVRISSIGRGLDSLANDKTYVHYIDRKTDSNCILLSIQKQPGTNTIKVINSIKALLPQIKEQMPASISLITIFDRSESIIDSVNDVKLTLTISFILVILVIYLLLGKLKDTLIPTVAIPMSLLGTFIVMNFLDYSIDVLSLLAITLSIGFLVDDAIVVLENSVRHVQQGESPFDAALNGSKQISTTVLSITVCLSIVFIPMLFLGDIIGRIFREFAVTIVVAIIFSGIISLSLTPLMAAHFIPKYTKKRRKNFAERVSSFVNDKLVQIYHLSLLFAFKHKMFILGGGFFCLVSSIILITVLPKEFLPNDDAGFLRGQTQAIEGTSPYETMALQKKLHPILLSDPAVEYLVSMVGTGGSNEGFLFIRLKSFEDRGPIEKIIGRISPKLAIPGLNSFISTLPLLNLQVGSTSRSLYEFALTSLNQKDLNKTVAPFVNHLKATPGFTQISSDLQLSQPQLEIEILKDRAYLLNVSSSLIENILLYAYSDNRISTINTSTDQYDVLIETLPKYYKDKNGLLKLYLKSPINQKLIPLKEVIKINNAATPLSVNHINGIPSGTISFNLENMTLGQAINKINVIADKIMPTSVKGNLLGTTDIFQKAFANIAFLCFIALFVIYIILGILYENFIHPLTVMSALPPTAFGGLLMLYIFDLPLSLYSFVGLIMLIGIVMKNGIMMVDFANDNRLKGQNAEKAIVGACMIRFRPIFMTFLAALMGAIPIAMGIGGASAQGRKPLGFVIVGGLIVSQILTLYLTPVIYYYLEIFQEKVSKKSAGGPSRKKS